MILTGSPDKRLNLLGISAVAPDPAFQSYSVASGKCPFLEKKCNLADLKIALGPASEVALVPASARSVPATYRVLQGKKHKTPTSMHGILHIGGSLSSLDLPSMSDLTAATRVVALSRLYSYFR